MTSPKPCLRKGDVTGPRKATGVDEYVLDSSAFLAFLKGEPGATLVASIMASEGFHISISAINLGEVFHLTLRHRSEAVALEVEARTLQSPNIEVVESTWDRVKAAAKLKAAGGLSYADCFAAALALERAATLITSDSEFRTLEMQGKLKVLWLPSAEPGHQP